MRSKASREKLNHTFRSLLLSRRVAREYTQAAIPFIAEHLGGDAIAARSVLLLTDISSRHEGGRNLSLAARYLTSIHRIDFRKPLILDAVEARHTAFRQMFQSAGDFIDHLKMRSREIESLMLMLEAAAEHGALREWAEQWTMSEGLDWPEFTRVITGPSGRQP
jgi:hypothetical protein